MDEAEVAGFLAEQRTVICASVGADGWPHLMPLWYIVRDAQLWAWTYAASQKVRNLERDPRATLQIETGEQYDQLRGVMLKVTAVTHRELDQVADAGREIFARYVGEEAATAPVREMVERQALKRVALQFVESSRVSWDHRKLGGTY
jgi:hypothetical protein